MKASVYTSQDCGGICSPQKFERDMIKKLSSNYVITKKPAKDHLPDIMGIDVLGGNTLMFCECKCYTALKSPDSAHKLWASTCKKQYERCEGLLRLGYKGFLAVRTYGKITIFKLELEDESQT